MKYELTTRKEYDFYECSSAFQKSIRRNKEKEAIFFGFELYASGYKKYVWKRMFIIASEDIGLADDNVSVKLNALYNNWKFVNDAGANGSSVPFIHAIMILCRAKKSRICDHAKIYAMTTNDNFKIPDYALDVHTKRGKIKNRSYDHFVNESSKIENDAHLIDEYYDHFRKYLDDYQNKKIDHTGYDKRNVIHKNAKDMDKWKRDNTQTKLF